MELSPEQKKAIEEQKESCIFCKIIKGEVPSSKVYEDDQIIAILDINPAAKGHLLVMPKEHYPIMPLIPEDTFKHLFLKVKELDGAVKEALLCKENTIFIANGGAAGQQSQHFMLHIIPRENNDGLEVLNVEGKDTPEKDIEEVQNKCKILEPMLQKNLAILGYLKQKSKTGTGMPKITKEQLIQIIEQNPQIKQAIIQSPQQFRQLVPNHPQLKELFEGQDIEKITEEVRSRTKKKGKIELEGI